MLPDLKTVDYELKIGAYVAVEIHQNDCVFYELAQVLDTGSYGKMSVDFYDQGVDGQFQNGLSLSQQKVRLVEPTRHVCHAAITGRYWERGEIKTKNRIGMRNIEYAEDLLALANKPELTPKVLTTSLTPKTPISGPHNAEIEVSFSIQTKPAPNTPPKPRAFKDLLTLQDLRQALKTATKKELDQWHNSARIAIILTSEGQGGNVQGCLSSDQCREMLDLIKEHMDAFEAML